MNRLAICLTLALAGCATLPPSVTGPVSGAPTPAPAEQPAVVAAQTVPADTPIPVLGDGPLKPIEASPASLTPVTSVALPNDIWERMRSGFAMPDLDNNLVRERERWYARQPDYIERMTDRANRYLYYIVEEVQARKMPLELALLPFIESAFNPEALSRAKASGMWQFMPKTGKNFDLTQNAFRDDRLDVMASTRAALDYLQKLYNQFGDWHLALAAYNWGEGNVSRAQAYNRKRGKGTGYEDLRMPNETRHYVPKFQAIKNIIAHPDRFGIQLRVIKNHPYFQTIPLDFDIDVAKAAELASLTVEEFRQLNPSAKRPLLMGAVTDNLLLPWDNAEIFQKNLKTHASPLATWTVWIAPKNLRTADAAKLVHMSEAQLREVNDIPKNTVIRKGSALVVPRTQQSADVSERIAETGQINLMPEYNASHRVVVVQRGETLGAIARRHRVSVKQLLQWNHLKDARSLRAGQKLLVANPGVAVASKKQAVKNADKKRTNKR